MAFHTNDGLFFCRLPDGSVEVTHRVPVLAIEGSPIGFATLHRWVLGCVPPGKGGDCTWASVVATMSRPGETSETFAAALKFHDGGAPEAPAK